MRHADPDTKDKKRTKGHQMEVQLDNIKQRFFSNPFLALWKKYQSLAGGSPLLSDFYYSLNLKLDPHHAQSRSWIRIEHSRVAISATWIQIYLRECEEYKKPKNLRFESFFFEPLYSVIGSEGFGSEQLHLFDQDPLHKYRPASMLSQHRYIFARHLHSVNLPLWQGLLAERWLFLYLL